MQEKIPQWEQATRAGRDLEKELFDLAQQVWPTLDTGGGRRERERILGGGGEDTTVGTGDVCR
jgi:hypothetical protein